MFTTNLKYVSKVNVLIFSFFYLVSYILLFFEISVKYYNFFKENNPVEYRPSLMYYKKKLTHFWKSNT